MLVARLNIPEPVPALTFERVRMDKTFDAAYHFEPIKDGAQIIWTCRVHASESYRFIEALVGQAMAMETEASFAILKKLLEEGRA